MESSDLQVIVDSPLYRSNLLTIEALQIPLKDLEIGSWYNNSANHGLYY